MTSEVQTPLTQALSEDALTRAELKALMQRSDKPAFIRLCVWVLLLICTAGLINLTLGSWTVIFAMLLHGVVLVHHFSLQHECCHYTAFKTRWINDAVGNVCGLIIMLPNRFFRYEHCDHHTFTQVRGKDTEMIELPQSLGEYFFYLSSYPYWKTKFSELWRHARGHLTAQDKRFVPRQEHTTIIWEARLMVVFYLVLACLSFAAESAVLLWYWLIPVVLGEPVMRAIRMTEHVGRPTTSDMTVNTRSNIVSMPWRFLCWNMNYHAEHHYAASVPFHALPALSEKLKGRVYTESQGYLGAHRDMLSQILQRKTKDE